jgi:hypothetical protein
VCKLTVLVLQAVFPVDQAAYAGGLPTYGPSERASQQTRATEAQ